MTAPEVLNSETAPAFDHGFLNGQTWSGVNLHVSLDCNAKCWVTAELIICVTVKEFGRQRFINVAAIQRCLWSLLLHSKTAGDEVRLIANAGEFVAKSSEAQGIDRAIVCLKIINPTHHWFARLDKLIRDRNAA